MRHTIKSFVAKATAAGKSEPMIIPIIELVTAHETKEGSQFPKLIILCLIILL
jgi:hypothetical protein